VKSLVIVVPELLPVPPVQGGAVEHWVDEASRRLIGAGVRLAIVSRPAHSAGQSGIEYIGIPWTKIERFFHRVKERVTWKNPLRYLAKIQNVFSYGRRVARVITNFDVVYLHNEPNLLLFMQKRAGQKNCTAYAQRSSFYAPVSPAVSARISQGRSCDLRE